jgi:plasmid stability protein
MKTALDLPDELMREVKIHAVLRGRKLKDAVADLLRAGLDCPSGTAGAAVVAEDPATGLPMIECSPAGAPGDDLTPDAVAAVLAGQEAAWHREAGRR